MPVSKADGFLRLVAGASLLADADRCKNQAPTGTRAFRCSRPAGRQEIAGGNLIPRTFRAF